jgi:PKD repeat protein
VIELIDKSVYSVGDTVYFDFGDGQTSDLDQVTHSYDEDGFYTVKAIGKGKLCSYEKIIQVPIFTLSVPNVITPGIEDGKNDYLLVQFGDRSETPNAIGLQANLSVINRWGKVVFETNDYQNNWKAENSPAGVYYFAVVMDGYAECTGWVEVIK